MTVSSIAYYQVGTDLNGKPIMRLFDNLKSNVGWLDENDMPTVAYERAHSWETVDALHNKAKVLGLILIE